MRRGIFNGAYVEGFLAHLDLTGCSTLLDVGCGPGTIALSVAPRLHHVYGLDYSPGMLEVFASEALARGIAHATPILRNWSDDWADVPVCDIVVASRSSQVDDLEAALAKLHAHATRRVYVTLLAGGRFFEPAIYDALGRDVEPLPDYIYAVNILRQRGIHPTLDYLDGENRLRNCVDFDDFVRKISWSLGNITTDERERLRDLYEHDLARIGTTPVRWALVSWQKA